MGENCIWCVSNTVVISVFLHSRNSWYKNEHEQQEMWPVSFNVIITAEAEARSEAVRVCAHREIRKPE